ncbi:MAG: DUF2795 domain-containing protein [Armatimonadetes bacterium]|nr:DUF2795 domain-containing protein [Armatimonadota bacterium]
MAKVVKYRTPLMLGAYIDDIIFPCSRTELLYRAEENDAPDALLDAIETLPERRYWSVEDIVARFNTGAVVPPVSA